MCDQAAAMADQNDAYERIKAIRNVVNSANNLVFFQYARSSSTSALLRVY